MDREIIPVEFNLQGKMFNENYTSLHELILAYSSFESIVDTTYSNIRGIDRISQRARSDYSIRLMQTEKGSWNSVFDLFVAVSPVLFGTPLSPAALLKTIKATYDFIKCTFTLKQNGNIYTIENSGDGTVKVNTADGQNIFNAPVNINVNIVTNATEILPDVKNFTEQIKKGFLSELSIKSSEMDQSIHLSKKDEHLFDLVEKTETDTKNVVAELYRYNKRSRTGKLQIDPQQSIPEGKYSFFVKTSTIQDELIMSMLKPNIKIVVWEYFVENPLTLENELQKLEIVEIGFDD